MRELTAVAGKVKKKEFSNTFSCQASGNRLHYRLYYVVMSKTEGQTFQYRFGNETKTFCMVSFPNLSCFDLVQNLFGPNLPMISFDGADRGTNSDVLLSFLLDVGTFA